MLIIGRKASAGQRRLSFVLGLIIVAALTFGRLAHGESQQDLLVFASLGGLDRFSASDPAIEETDE